jgi:integration host factor subunit alpha
MWPGTFCRYISENGEVEHLSIGIQMPGQNNLPMVNISGNGMRNGLSQNETSFFSELQPMTLTKDHLISSIQNHLGISKFESSRIIESVLETVKKALESGDDVLTSGLGKFSVRKKAARRGRNPATGEDLTLDARTVVMFKCSPVLREKVNGGARDYGIW